jgi:hypothetical protein
MNINELDSYRLGDAVKFNDKLNPKLWGSDEHLHSQIREQLLRIAEDFAEFLGVSNFEIKDITVSGSNAAYTYTDNSDIDLHLVVDLPRADASEVYRELFDAKKYQYNDQHNITIGGYDVELYVQNANQPHISQGIYSVLNNDWVSVPRRARPTVDDISTRSKYETLSQQIDQAIESKDYEMITALVNKIKKMRQAGLEQHGEFGPENIAFKMLRSQGAIERLYAARNAAKDELLSLDERRKKKRKAKKSWGYFGGYWYPGTGYAGQDTPAAQAASDGGGDGGAESIREDAGQTDEQILQDFIRFCVAELKIKQMPVVKLRKDPEWPRRHRTFGRYSDDDQQLEVAWGNRHIMDVLRTVAHELTHKRQHEREAVPPSAGETGSEYENEANARAGVLMRDWARLHPEHFEAGQANDLEEGWKERVGAVAAAACIAGTPGCSTTGQAIKTTQDVGRTVQTAKNMTRAGVQDELSQELRNFIRAQGGDPGSQNLSTLYKLQKRMQQKAPAPQNESASGYIPTKKQAKDPRFSMALTVDIKPGQVGKEANKLKLKTDRQGAPQIARADGLFENLFKEYKRYKADEFDPDLFEISDELRRNYLGRAGQQVDRRQERMAAVRDRLNKGYEIYHAQDPTRIVHRFEADTPAEARRYYEQYDADYDSDVDYDLRLRRATGIMESARQQYLWHGSRQKIPMLEPRQSVDTGGAAGSNQNAIYATTDPKVAIAMGLTTPGSDTGMFPNDPQMVLFSGKIRKGENVYLHKLPMNGPDGKPQFVQGGNTREFHSVPGVKAVKPVEIKAVPVDKYLNLIRTATPQDLELRKKYIAEDEELDEVKMSPGALEKFATSKEAQGIRAGFEAELIFRDTQGESDEEDPEPDYDADERAYSISQVIEFFDNDEYGYGLSDRERNRLEENLDETYMNWRDEQMTSDFRNDAEDLVREIHLDEVPLSERIIKVLTDGMEIDDAEADKILAVGVDAPKFNSSSEQAAYAEQNPNYKIYLEALDDAEAILDEEVETSIEKQDGYYDQALDDYRDNWSGDDDSFFSDVGLRWMSDIANEYGLDWPVWNMGNGGNSGSRDWDEIGAELQQVVGMPVKVSSNYHSTPRKEGQWIIEPDGSLSPDDRSEEAGLEIVSPPMPLLMTLEKLKAVTDWANDPARGNAYTNSSTGLHMGVSLPTRGGDVDYVKLILFMGDNYVKQQFGREANNFCASALDKLRQNIKGGKSDPAGVIKLLKHGLTELAYKELQKGVGTSKYTSAHLQNGYIEFRSPGGDWLAKADEEIDILENTMLRFARAMAIAGDPSADRQEYAKKLYKLVTADNEQYADQLRLFSKFSAGTIDKEQLKKQWAEKTIGKEKEINQRWKLYQKVNGTWTAVPGAEWNNYSEDQVKNAVWSKYGREALDSGEYQLVNMGEQEWEVYDVKTGKTLEVVKGKSKGEVANAVYDKYVDQGIGFQVRPYEDPAKLTPRAKLAKRIVEPKKQPTPAEQQAKNERGVPYWEIFDIQSGNTIHTFLSDDLPDAVTDAYNWLVGIGAERPELFKVRPKMIPNPQTTDNKKDSADLQRTLGVQDVDTDVAQNFEPRRQNYELVSDEDPDRVLHRMSNATADEVRAWIAQQEAGGMPPGFLRTRIVAESWRSSIAQAIVRVEENFADGKVKGKSRPGRVKRAGASCAGSVTDLRRRAKNASGEKAKMYHWCANMKSGRKK